MGNKQSIKKICTKDSPFVPPLKDDEQWEHPDLYDKFPEHEFRVVIFHCPNCKIDIAVDMDPDGPSLEKHIMDKNGHTADCCRKEEHSDNWHVCEGCQTHKAPCKLCYNCSVNKRICSHCKQKVV
ncbi:MAG: hypothetical protein G01um101413_640 [Parcubacteria group bacterium Gr01-1014_13]|nr:MAG: hypothetical protein G01um101413_640 [Parcubacteria group bacterium Gr01-1014_13]